MMRAFLVGCLVVLLSGAATSFYLPGVAPRDFHDGDVVDLKVNSVTSFMTKLPYKYYSLKFCEPEGGVKDMAENLGEVLSGDRIENSPYELIMGKNEYCKFLCTQKRCNHHVAAILELPVRLQTHSTTQVV